MSSSGQHGDRNWEVNAFTDQPEFNEIIIFPNLQVPQGESHGLVSAETAHSGSERIEKQQPAFDAG